MIPLRDENPSLTVPFVTRALIVVNTLVFVYELLLGPDLREFMNVWGLRPERLVMSVSDHASPLLPALATVFTSMFLHGGWSHLIGNMWYLYIFGDNVEDALGHVPYVLFYFASGVTAAALHTLTHTSSMLPTVGASGAIAGVLGAYAFAYPGARVVTLVPLFPFFQIVRWPAWVVLGLWFVLQFILGVGTLGQSAGGTGGIAIWAHIGGFAFGWAAMALLGRRTAPAVAGAE